MSENYSWRKRYQRGYGEESASPALKKVLDSMKSKSVEYEPHVIEPYDIDRKIKRSDKTPLTKEEIEWRHAELKKRNQWKGLV